MKQKYFGYWIFGGIVLIGALCGVVSAQATSWWDISSLVPSYAQPIAALNSRDFDSDDSLQRYLNPDRPFHDLEYVPVDLTPIPSNFTANAARKFLLRKEAGEEFADMARHFWDHFHGDRLALISTYRSKAYQDTLIRRGCDQDQCAPWGTSEHQAGLAVDLRIVTKQWKTISMDTSSIYTEWLHAHAHEWWFHNTYQKWLAIDGKIVEGWHRRYLGLELAKILYDKGETIAEYYNWTNN